MEAAAHSLSGLGAGRARTAGAATERRLLSWRGAVIALVVVIWMIPIKRYALPVALPFNLEPYRLLMLAIMAVWLVAALIGNARLSAAGHGKAITAMMVAAIVALISNRDDIAVAGLQVQSIKSFSFFLSYSIAFLLVASTISRVRDVDAVVKAIAFGALVVALEALYESRTRSNLFDDLHKVLPFLDFIGKERTNFAGGALRVRASAQHPIALGAGLVICTPIVLYVAGRAATKWRRWFWYAACAVILMGALATESRTVVLALIAMLVAALRVRGRRLLRYWPVLLALVLVTHVAAPGVVSHLYKRFTPKGGILKQQQVRAGQRGSGRVADIGPGIAKWKQSPLFGHGLGTVAATGDKPLPGQESSSGVSIIYDDQYLNTLVSIGAVGLLAVIWFVWGSVRKLIRAARQVRGEVGDLLSACAVATAGFAVAMFTFDAFSFVQGTLIFFIIAALGLRARASVLG